MTNDAAQAEAAPQVDASSDASSTDVLDLDASDDDDAASAMDARAPADAVDADDGEVTDAGAADGSPDAAGACSASATGTAARSTGYAGTSAAFFGLFNSTPCSAPSDCVPACTQAGGTSASCATGSLCLPDFCPDGGNGCVECLPPTYWLDTAGALGQPGSGASATAANDLQAFDNGYNDTLEVTSTETKAWTMGHRYFARAQSLSTRHAFFQHSAYVCTPLLVSSVRRTHEKSSVS